MPKLKKQVTVLVWMEQGQAKLREATVEVLDGTPAEEDIIEYVVRVNPDLTPQLVRSWINETGEMEIRTCIVEDPRA